ncbi:MAG TPA: class I SAM-dependent methyltransferase [Chthoniobacterales bacterium]
MPNESNVLETGLAAHEVDTMRAVEDELWWYRALRHHVLKTLEVAREDFDLLDAGCGSGGMLARIRERFPKSSLTGVDVSERALELTAARNSRAALVHGRVDALPFADAAFDFVLSLDVLTVRGVDDRRAMTEMFRVLRPNGRLVLNLPAFQFLRGSHDIAVNQVRRVTRADVVPFLRKLGFTIERCTYWNMTLTPLIATIRWASRDQTNELRSDLKPVWPPLNFALTRLTKAELAISRIVPLPFGTSLFVVARK